MVELNLPKKYEKLIPHYFEYKSNLKLTPVALDLLKMRYLKRDDEGKIIEDPLGMFYRVAKNIAKADMRYGAFDKSIELKFFHHMADLDFIPASPILMNAGNTLQYLFSDHALDVGDSIGEIFDVLKLAATIQQHGGGVGFSFSKIRPRHDDVSGMKNVAFGPLSVMRIFDTSFSAILQGGRRQGANMAILHISHPDIITFIESKKDLSSLQNFNLSVAITNDFIDAVKADKDFNLVNPRNNEIVKTVPAREIFDKLVEQAWRTGDPGIVFIDEMNDKYPFRKRSVLSTGSCAQYELEAFQGVPYAHINLSRMIKEKNNSLKIDEDKLKSVTRLVVHFLDNCLDMHKYDHPLIEKRTKEARKIGLGIMGFADLLFKLGIPYDSDDALELIENIMRIIQEESRSASIALAKKRGAFPLYQQSTWQEPIRHATITSIAPTGSTSIIAGASQSIEPVYALSFTTKTSGGEEFTLLNESFKNAVDAMAIDRTAKVQLQFVDTVQNISWLDDKFKKVFKTSMDIAPISHLKVMATFQKYIDNSISKTINLPNSATVDDIAEIFLRAHQLHCKGVTIYRDGCRDDQALITKRQTRLSAFEDDTTFKEQN